MSEISAHTALFLQKFLQKKMSEISAHTTLFVKRS